MLRKSIRRVRVQLCKKNAQNKRILKVTRSNKTSRATRKVLLILYDELTVSFGRSHIFRAFWCVRDKHANGKYVVPIFQHTVCARRSQVHAHFMKCTVASLRTLCGNFYHAELNWFEYILYSTLVYASRQSFECVFLDHHRPWDTSKRNGACLFRWFVYVSMNLSVGHQISSSLLLILFVRRNYERESQLNWINNAQELKFVYTSTYNSGIAV